VAFSSEAVPYQTIGIAEYNPALPKQILCLELGETYSAARGLGNEISFRQIRQGGFEKLGLSYRRTRWSQAASKTGKVRGDCTNRILLIGRADIGVQIRSRIYLGMFHRMRRIVPQFASLGNCRCFGIFHRIRCFGSPITILGNCRCQVRAKVWGWIIGLHVLSLNTPKIRRIIPDGPPAYVRRNRIVTELPEIRI
jgi:hypothetical protein